MTLMTDSHCHLNHQDFADDLHEVIERAHAAGVSLIICVGYDLPSSRAALHIATEAENVYATVGIHPHDANTFTKQTEQEIESLAAHEKVVAIGETGLDYYRDLSPRYAQQEAFRQHLRLAHKLSMPVVVHSRNAWRDVIRILDEEGIPAKGVVMHCFPSEPDFADAALSRGCFLGLAGPVTFSNSSVLRNIAGSTPMDKMLVETDAPYLAPHPYRGKRNEPSYLPLIVNTIAQVKEVQPEEIARHTTANALRIFGIG